MRIIQVGPGAGMSINVGPNGTTMSGNATVTEVSNQELLDFLQVMSGNPPSEEDSEELDDNEETDCCSDSDEGEESEFVPAIVYPEHLSSRWILSMPRREDESEEKFEERKDRVSAFIQEGLEKEFPTLSVSISYTLGTLMGSTTIPQQVVTSEVSGFNTMDEFEQQIATSRIVKFGEELFGRFN